MLVGGAERAKALIVINPAEPSIMMRDTVHCLTESEPDRELAAGAGFFALGAYQPSPDWRWLAYSTDFSGDERFTIRIKDLATGTLLPDEIPGAYYGCSWSQDGSPWRGSNERRRWPRSTSATAVANTTKNILTGFPPRLRSTMPHWEISTRAW